MDAKRMTLKMNYETKISKDVDKYGWSAIEIRDYAPPFVYTVGLMVSHGHPELIVFGLPNEGYGVLAAMVHDIAEGRSFSSSGEFTGVLTEGLVATRTVHETQHEFWLGYAMGFCRENGRIGGLQAMQVFWPDNSGRFPFDSECDHEIYTLQPRLDLPQSESEIK